MKFKFFTIIMMISILLICGCNAKNTSTVSGEEQNIDDKFDIVDNREYVKPTYTIKEIGGRFYMNFSDGNEYQREDPLLMPHYPSGIDYDSLDNMKSAIENNTFSGSDVEIIKNVFSKDNVKGIKIIDTNKIYKPVLPSGVESVSCLWKGNSYSCQFGSQMSINGWFVYLQKEDYDKKFENEYEDWLSNENITLTSAREIDIEGITAIEYRFKTSKASLKKIRYKIEVEGKVLYVDEHYATDCLPNVAVNVSETNPAYIHIYGSENGAYFFYTLHNVFGPVSPDLLSSFGAELYTK